MENTMQNKIYRSIKNQQVMNQYPYKETDSKGRVEMSNENKVSQVRTSQNEPEREQRIFTFKATQLIWLAFGILEALIALRIGLKLIGANPESPIVALIYGFTYLFLFPFEGMTATPSAGAMVLELSSLFAMAIYGLIAWAVERVVWVVFYRPRGSAVAITETTTSDHTTRSG
jgi:hypothetical protein